LELGQDPEQSSVALTADSRSLIVREGTGGIQALGDDDKAGIKQTIDDEVLQGTAIEFRSSKVEVSPGGEGLTVQGELELAGRTQPMTFELTVAGENRITGTATFKQTGWGIKPYSALFGTLKVADAVDVAIDASLTAS
jgi:polyisoprenoid-binding protein YceI